MDPEPRNDTRDRSHPGWGNSTEVLKEGNVTPLNTADIRHTPWDSLYFRYTVILSVSGLICLCGMVGNGTVVWLLGFRTRRNPYSVYILNLAVADFTYLLSCVLETIAIINYYYYYYFFYYASILAGYSFSVGLILLMAVSTERCVSVLWPIWYKCHRPAHLSEIVCALIWGLLFCLNLVEIVYKNLGVGEFYGFWIFCNNLALFTLPVLCVSGLVLVIWGRCCSLRRQPSKLYWTVLLNVLAVLLLNGPRRLYTVGWWPKFFQIDIWAFMVLLSAVNSSVNPVIYFFVGRHGEQRGRKPLREVLQSALADGEAGTEQRGGITGPRQDVTTPEHQGGQPRPVPMSDPAPGTAPGKVSDSP